MKKLIIIALLLLSGCQAPQETHKPSTLEGSKIKNMEDNGIVLPL